MNSGGIDGGIDDGVSSDGDVYGDTGGDVYIPSDRETIALARFMWRGR